MATALSDIRSFVAGDISPTEFRERLYSDHEFESFLANDPNLPIHGYVKGSVYQFLLEQDFEDPGDILSAQGALVEFMDRNRIDYTKTDRYEQLFDMILKAQPAWLGAPAKFVQEKMLPEAGNLEGKALQTWLKDAFRKRFKFAKKPPKWIQGANWPINENGPLVFLGQFDVNDYFHDAASVYVFHDPVKGTCETIIQVF
jgi:hypothetical protein